jgi:hypothetical protein
MRALRVHLIVAMVVIAGATGAAAVQSTATPASDTTGEMKLSSAEGTVGDTVTVKLSLTGNEVAGYQAAVRYDPAIVSFESATGAEFDAPIVNSDDGIVRLTKANPTTVGADLVAAKLTFTIEKSGQTELSLVSSESRVYAQGELNDGDISDHPSLPVTVSSGTITATSEAGGGGIAAPPVGDAPSDDGDSKSSEQAGDEEVGATDSDQSEAEADQQSADDQQSTEETDTQSQQSSNEDETATAQSDTDEESSSSSAAEEKSDTASESSGTPGFESSAAVAILLGLALIATRRD